MVLRKSMPSGSTGDHLMLWDIVDLLLFSMLFKCEVVVYGTAKFASRTKCGLYIVCVPTV